jgi:hypothetical protein
MGRVLATKMILSSVSARLILFAFAVAQAILAWSIRFVPRPIKNPLVRAIVTVGVTTAAGLLVLEEMLQYSAATGHVPLKNDNFFVMGIVVQHVISLVIIFNSDSALRRKEALPKS